MHEISISIPNSPPTCLDPLAVNIVVTVTWDAILLKTAVNTIYRLKFQMLDSNGTDLGNSPQYEAIEPLEPGKNKTVTAGANTEGVIFLVTLEASTNGGTAWTKVNDASSSPYDVKDVCPVNPTNPGTGGDGPTPGPTGRMVAGLPTRIYSTPVMPTVPYRYVHAIVERFRKSGGVETFVRIEHVEFADYYPPQDVPNTPRYQAEVPFFIKPFDPSSVYYVYFLFVNREGSTVAATDKLKMV